MKEKAKRTSIGGQAVMEGVMMRGAKSEAIAVRDGSGAIRVESKRVKPQAEKNLFFRLPVVRGVISFFLSLVGGIKVLLRSAEVFGEGEPSKFEKWLAKKLKINVMSVVTTISLLIGLALAIVLFIYLPQIIRDAFEKWFSVEFNPWAKNFIEGGVKITIFVLYILAVSLLKDIKRTFMYHGAEHKTITCFESGMPLTVENAKKCRRVHDRCGTTFMVFVLVISIIVFAVFEATLAVNNIELNKYIRILCKIGFLPVVAGLSYELLKALAKTKSPLVYPIKIPGLLLQRLTTKEPDEKMLEVAITAFNEVYAMDADPSIQCRGFFKKPTVAQLTEYVTKKLAVYKIDEVAEAEWIVSLSLNIARSQVYGDTIVSFEECSKVNSLVNERVTGRPLWYCIGDVDFMGYKLKVNESVLIPRPETELIVENALKVIDVEKSVLDLCTGSGAIAISVALKSGAKVTACDVSESAVKLAQENAKNLNADVNFVVGDMFSALSADKKFDVIISNPPYIKSGDIELLQPEIKNFEPKIALDGGSDGLDFYRIIAENAKKYLNESGYIFIECGETQAEEIKNLLTDFTDIEIIKDYDNKDRIIKAVLCV